MGDASGRVVRKPGSRDIVKIQQQQKEKSSVNAAARAGAAAASGYGGINIATNVSKQHRAYAHRENSINMAYHRAQTA